METTDRDDDETPPAETPPTETTRRRLVERFAAWLDETLARPEPPQGIAAELLAELEEAGAAEDDDPDGDDSSGGDLYSLWSAVTALTQEVRLQGRAFQRLTDEIALRDARSARELERRVRRETIDVLLDLRDRLERGLRAASDQLAAMPDAPPRAARFVPRLREAWERPLAAARALRTGYALSLERLDEELDRLGVRPLESLGRPFDPHAMTAVDVEDTTPERDGTVLESYLQGYAWGDEILRPARVKVGRAGRETRSVGSTGDDVEETEE